MWRLERGERGPFEWSTKMDREGRGSSSRIHTALTSPDPARVHAPRGSPPRDLARVRLGPMCPPGVIGGDFPTSKQPRSVFPPL